MNCRVWLDLGDGLFLGLPMLEKRSVDAQGAVMLVGFSLLLAFNQVVIKVANGGFQPVYLAALRSLGAVFVLALWMRWRGRPMLPAPENLWPSVLLGALFSAEFIFLFLALDLTTVSRVSILFYSMPIWLAVAAHFLLPNEKLSRLRVVGLVLAISGVAWAVFDRSELREPSFWGDILALSAAVTWAGIALCVRMTGLARERPETQLFVQLAVSLPLLFGASLFFGDLMRDPTPIHWAGLAFQSVVVACFGFLFWFWLVSVYKASGVASFSFLSPVFSVALGWLILNEQIGRSIIGGLILVAAGLMLINRK